MGHQPGFGSAIVHIHGNAVYPSIKVSAIRDGSGTVLINEKVLVQNDPFIQELSVPASEKWSQTRNRICYEILGRLVEITEKAEQKGENPFIQALSGEDVGKIDRTIVANAVFMNFIQRAAEYREELIKPPKFHRYQVPAYTPKSKTRHRKEDTISMDLNNYRIPGLC